LYFFKGSLGGLGGAVLACVAFYFGTIANVYIRSGMVGSWSHLSSVNLPVLSLSVVGGFALGFYVVVR
jgi:hypothetical protein